MTGEHGRGREREPGPDESGDHATPVSQRDPGPDESGDRATPVSQRVIVTAADDRMGDLDDLADRLRDAGMEVERVLAMGVITGAVAVERRAALVAVDGVAAVEDERTFSVPPPPSDIQ